MIIRELSEQDLVTRVAWMNHFSVYKTMHYDLPVSIERTNSWFSQKDKKSDRVDLVFIFDSELVAMGGLTSIDQKVKKAELYIFVNPNKQGQGLGSQAIQLLCNYAFSYINLNKIYLEVDEDNSRARYLYESSSFKLDGVLRQDSIRDDKLINRCVYSLLKKEHDIR